MKKLHKMTALFLTGMTAVTLLAGCGAQPATETDIAPERTPASVEESPVESEAPAKIEIPIVTEAPAETPAPEEQEAPKLKQVKILVHPTGGGTMYFTVDYDEEGRASAMYCRFDEDTEPATPAEDDAMYVDYSSGMPDVYYRPEFVNAYLDAPYLPSIADVQTYDDGSLKLVYGGFGAALEFEFDENGLPTYVLCAQDDISHKLTYTQGADGRFAFADGAEIYGHFIDGFDIPYTRVAPDVYVNHSASYEGWVEYQ